MQNIFFSQPSGPYETPLQREMFLLSSLSDSSKTSASHKCIGAQECCEYAQWSLLGVRGVVGVWVGAVPVTCQRLVHFCLSLSST